jgi:hypothetical protein
MRDIRLVCVVAFDEVTRFSDYKTVDDYVLSYCKANGLNLAVVP